MGEPVGESGFALAVCRLVEWPARRGVPWLAVGRRQSRRAMFAVIRSVQFGTCLSRVPKHFALSFPLVLSAFQTGHGPEVPRLGSGAFRTCCGGWHRPQFAAAIRSSRPVERSVVGRIAPCGQ